MRYTWILCLLAVAGAAASLAARAQQPALQQPPLVSSPAVPTAGPDSLILPAIDAAPSAKAARPVKKGRGQSRRPLNRHVRHAAPHTVTEARPVESAAASKLHAMSGTQPGPVLVSAGVPSSAGRGAAPVSGSPTAVRQSLRTPPAPDFSGPLLTSAAAPAVGSRSAALPGAVPHVGAAAPVQPMISRLPGSSASPIHGDKVKPEQKAAAAVAVSGNPKSSDTVLTQTKPDGFAPVDTSRDHTLDNPLQVVGEGWKMIAYLVPTLVFILVCLSLMRRYQLKNGRLPGVVQAAARGAGRPAFSGGGGGLLAALLGRNSSERGGGASGSGIRVLESVPVGASTLHLVQVRGRVLLLAGSGSGVTLLTELEEREGIEGDEFRAMLQAAAADMDGLDLPEPDMPVSAVVGSLENVMRDTGDAMARRARRLRTVQEAEDSGL